jgi:NitT/TauT family transport system substrate-binding protein
MAWRLLPPFGTKLRFFILDEVRGSHMTNISRRSVIGGLAAGLLAAPYIARAATKMRVLTNWFAEAEHGGLYHAVASGLYEKAGLDVDLRQGGIGLNNMQLLMGGEADVVFSYDLATLAAREKGLPVKAISTNFQFDVTGLIVRPEVKTIDELKGRKIYFPNSGYSTFWPWLKQKYGFTDEMAGPKGQNLQTFFTDPGSAVTGFMTADPYIAERQNIQTGFLLFAKEGYPPYSNIMVSSDQYIDGNRQAVAAFVKATSEGWRDYYRDSRVGNDYIKKVNPKMDDGQIEFSLRKMREVKVIEGGDAETMGIGIMTPARWKQTRDFMVEYKLLKAETDYMQALAPEFTRDIKIVL